MCTIKLGFINSFQEVILLLRFPSGASSLSPPYRMEHTYIESVRNARDAANTSASSWGTNSFNAPTCICLLLTSCLWHGIECNLTFYHGYSARNFI